MPKREAAAAAKTTEVREHICEADGRERMLDKTLADSFPASDPPSSIPDPCAEDSMPPGKAA